MAEVKRRRRFGDRRDGRYVRELAGLPKIMANLMPHRTEREVYFHDNFDATALVDYLEKKNAGGLPYKITIFHCILLILARMVKERPLMNRFIQGGRTYERNEISLSFVAKRRFADGAEESLMVIRPGDDDTIESIAQKIVGDVREMRKSETATGGIDKAMDIIGSLPRPLSMFVVWCVRVLDFWGKCPKGIMEGDPNFTTILASNLGSIHCPAVYHHLNDYGTNSIMVTIGELHKDEILQADGHRKLCDAIEIGATIDESIADGFYFARSLKLIQYILANPALLDVPIGTPSGYTYE